MKRLLILFFVIAALALAGAFAWESANFTAPGPEAPQGNQTLVLIPPGTATAAIAQRLESAGVVRSATLFRIAVRLHARAQALKAGEYAIPSRAPLSNIIAVLAAGKSIQHKLTAAEGLTSQMIYNLVDSNSVLSGPTGAVPAEGTLLPETYLFTRGVTRAQLLARMEASRNKLLDRLWAARTSGLPFQTPAQAVVMASIVEKETALPQERRHIAAVFINRLKTGMKLQSDPTIIYGLTKGYPLGHGIRASELASQTDYNTYVITGLPPTPICNPGKDSLAAVLRPADSNDLYFVADGTGGHVFAATVAEHLQNVAKWRAFEHRQQTTVLPPGSLRR